MKELSFSNHDEQAEFMDQVLEPLKAGQYDAVVSLCNEDVRALPQLIELAVQGRDAAGGADACRFWLIDSFAVN